MPTYVYKFVKTGETIEVQQAFTDEPLTHAKHPTTGRKMAVKKVFTPVGVTFRGDGFYKTDSRSATSSSSKAPSESASTATATGSSSDSGSAASTTTTDSAAAKAPKPATPAKKSTSAAD